MPHLARLALLFPIPGLALTCAWAQAPLDNFAFVRGTVPTPGFIEAADMNGDGIVDIVMGSAELVTEQPTPAALTITVSFGRPDGTFAPSASAAQLSGPIRAMDIADIDGDGDIDIAAIASRGPGTGTGTLEVWLNSGAGVFIRQTSLGLPYSLLNDLEIIDVDGNGDQDIFVSSGEGDGSSGFTGARWVRRSPSGQLSGLLDLVTSGFGTSRTRLADLDGDGDLDIAMAGSSAGGSLNELAWYENTAGFPIDFGTVQPLPLGAGQALDVVAFDADLDGDLDLAALVVNFSATDSLRILINDGSGGFTLSPNYPSPRLGRDLVVGDMDGDGDLDLLCTEMSGTFGFLAGSPTLMRNNGAGVFLGATSLGDDISSPRALDAADLDGDGLPEVLIAGSRSGPPHYAGQPSAQIRTNLTAGGSLNFSAATELLESLGLAPLHWADFNGDGLDDLCAQSTYGTTPFASVKLALGGGSFGEATRVADVAPLAPLRQGGPDAGDINGDGHADLVFLSPDSSSVQASLGDGGGQFSAASPLVAWFSDADFIELHDLDEDGDLDLIGTRVGGTRLVFSRGDGAGGFSPPGSIGGGFGAALQFAYVDLDGDGERDLVTTAGTALEWMRGQGGSSFASRAALASWPAAPSDFVTGDFNGDGAVDVAALTGDASGGSPASIYVTLGGGNGAFGAVTSIATSPFGWSTLRAVDFDLDGDDDLAAALGTGGPPLNGGLRAFESLGDGTFAPSVLIASVGPRVGQLSSSDIDGDGDQDLVAGLDDVAALGIFRARANRPLGAPFCIGAVPNSTGQVGSISAFGSDDPADNRLTIQSGSLPSSTFGFFLASLQSAYVTNVPGSEGILCLGGAIGRYVGPGEVQSSGAAGLFELRLDLTSIPQPGGAVVVTSGSNWNFQAWHRDTGAGGGVTSNFTDAIVVSF